MSGWKGLDLLMLLRWLTWSRVSSALNPQLAHGTAADSPLTFAACAGPCVLQGDDRRQLSDLLALAPAAWPFACVRLAVCMVLGSAQQPAQQSGQEGQLQQGSDDGPAATHVLGWLDMREGQAPPAAALVLHPDGSMGLLEGPPPTACQRAAARVRPASECSDAADVQLQRLMAAQDAALAERLQPPAPPAGGGEELASIAPSSDGHINSEVGAVGDGAWQDAERDTSFAAQLAALDARHSASIAAATAHAAGVAAEDGMSGSRAVGLSRG